MRDNREESHHSRGNNKVTIRGQETMELRDLQSINPVLVGELKAVDMIFAEFTNFRRTELV
jgi:hypothetical protein